MQNKKKLIEEIEKNLKEAGKCDKNNIFFVSDFKTELMRLTQISQQKTIFKYLDIFIQLGYIKEIDKTRGQFI